MKLPRPSYKTLDHSPTLEYIPKLKSTPMYMYTQSVRDSVSKPFRVQSFTTEFVCAHVNMSTCTYKL